MSLLSYSYLTVMLRLSFGKGSICIRKRCGNGSERDCKLYGLDGLYGCKRWDEGGILGENKVTYRQNKRL